MKIYNNYPLQTLTTFGTPATARRVALVEGSTLDEPFRLDHDIDELLASTLLNETYFILGGGSNVVFTRDYNGTIVKIGEAVFQGGSGDGCKYLTAGAALPLDTMVAYSVGRGYCGAENLSAIPGTVGGAVVQNAGAYGVETGDLVDRVWAVDLQERRRVEFEREECQFAYRSSLFKQYTGRYLIYRVRFRFGTEFSPNIKYQALAEELQRRGINQPTQHQMRDIITDIRWAKLPRPEEHGSAGSFFKNPVVDNGTYARLLHDYPDMPTYPGNKLSAGWLIDRAGWKGRTLGRAGVWPKQALVLYNSGGCTGKEVLSLAQAIQDDVMKQFGITLTSEAIII